MRYNSSIAVVFFPLCGNTNEQSVFTICCWLVKAQVFSANNEKKWFQSFSDVVGYMNFIIIFFATATTMTKNKLNCWDMEQQSVCVCCSDVPLVLIYPMHCCLWWPQCRSSSSDGIEFPCGKWRLRRIVCRPVQWNFIYTIEKTPIQSICCCAYGCGGFERVIVSVPFDSFDSVSQTIVAAQKKK